MDSISVSWDASTKKFTITRGTAGTYFNIFASTCAGSAGSQLIKVTQVALIHH